MNTSQSRAMALTFTIPPICQGQAVTYSFAYDSEHASLGNADCIIRRCQSPDHPDRYDRFIDPEFENEHSLNHEFWNGEPTLGKMTDSWTSDPHIPPCDSFFILGTNTFGHRLHWNGEKFTDQGSPWYYQSIADAEMDIIDHDGMENIGIYGSPEESGPSVFIKPVTP